jgi:hypothetical protein
LNSLLPLWGDRQPLDAERLSALKTGALAANNAAEFTHHIKLKGRAGQQGMVWVIPAFKLFEMTIGTVVRTDSSGQVVETAEEQTAFPLPVAARIIGLKSEG